MELNIWAHAIAIVPALNDVNYNWNLTFLKDATSELNGARVLKQSLAIII